MESEIYIEIILWDTKIPPREITTILKVLPDTELLKGERNKKLILPRANLWSLKSRKSSTSKSITWHWKEIETKIGHLKEEINSIIQDGLIKVSIVINLEEGQPIPSLTIPPEMSKFIAYFDIELEISDY